MTIFANLNKIKHALVKNCQTKNYAHSDVIREYDESLNYTLLFRKKKRLKEKQYVIQCAFGCYKHKNLGNMTRV